MGLRGGVSAMGVSYFGPYAHAYALRGRRATCCCGRSRRTCHEGSSTVITGSGVRVSTRTSRSARPRARRHSITTSTTSSSTTSSTSRRRARRIMPAASKRRVGGRRPARVRSSRLRGRQRPERERAERRSERQQYGRVARGDFDLTGIGRELLDSERAGVYVRKGRVVEPQGTVSTRSKDVETPRARPERTYEYERSRRRRPSERRSPGDSSTRRPDDTRLYESPDVEPGRRRYGSGCRKAAAARLAADRDVERARIVRAPQASGGAPTNNDRAARVAPRAWALPRSPPASECFELSTQGPRYRRLDGRRKRPPKRSDYRRFKVRASRPGRLRVDGRRLTRRFRNTCASATKARQTGKRLVSAECCCRRWKGTLGVGAMCRGARLEEI